MTLFTTSRCLRAVLILVAIAPGSLEAQRRRPTQEAAPTGAWPPISIGINGGYDDNSQGTVLGAQIRAPILRNGKIELMPGGSVTFLTGLKEYQFNLDAVFAMAGQRGGLYVAGGLAARNTIYEIGSERETRMGASIALGVRSGGGSRVGVHIEVRQIYVGSEFRPRPLTLGLDFPLWGGGSRRR